MTPRQRIAQIDKAIDGVTRELRRRERVKPLSAASWQAAWDKHPELSDEFNSLYFRRGFLQTVRDKADNRAYDAKQRKERARAAAAQRLEKDLRAAGLAIAA